MEESLRLNQRSYLGSLDPDHVGPNQYRGTAAEWTPTTHLKASGKARLRPLAVSGCDRMCRKRHHAFMATSGYIRTSRHGTPGDAESDPETQLRQFEHVGVVPVQFGPRMSESQVLRLRHLTTASSTALKLAALSGTLRANLWAAAITSLSQRPNSATHSPIVDFGMLNCRAISLRLGRPPRRPLPVPQ